jgi:Rrf2 family cysteine metabolism transcriptional repressor
MARIHSRGVLAHIDELAEAEAVPASYLVQILGDLRNGGLIVSRRGKEGGYALARPPEAITLAEVVRLIEGDVLEFNETGAGHSGRRVVQVWQEVRRVLEEHLRDVTIEKIAGRAGEPMYYI